MDNKKARGFSLHKTDMKKLLQEPKIEHVSKIHFEVH